MGKKLCTPATLAATVPPSTTVVMHLFLGAHVCAVIRVIVVSIIVFLLFFLLLYYQSPVLFVASEYRYSKPITK